jgi:hypothetical protein
MFVVAACWCGAAWSMPFDRAYWIAVSSGIVKVEVSRSGAGYAVGTGVVVGRDKVVTACHVLRGGSSVAVLHAGVRHGAVLRSISAEHDVCILQAPMLEATPVALRPTSQLAIGEDVGAIGFSAGAGVHFAHGGVVHLYKYDQGVVVQSGAAFTSGASGGGLFDADKRLVGILMFRMRGPGAQFFSVPVEWFADNLGQDGGGADRGISSEPFWNRAPDKLPYFMRANMLMSEERWDQLQPLLLQWQVAEPLSADPAFFLGELDSRRDRDVEAISEYREAVARDPGHALAWNGLVRASVRLRDLDLARRAYAKLASLSIVLSGRIAAEFPEVSQ